MTFLGDGGVASVPGSSQGALPRWTGIYYGVVSNNNDPKKQNRCLLRIPQIIGKAVTTWAVSLTPLQNPPAVGTLIAAMFIGGDLDYPCYLVVNPKIVVEATDGNVKPISTASHAGTSTKLAAADHVHGGLDTNSAHIHPINPSQSASAGTSGTAAQADHVHGVAGLLASGSGGLLQLLSSQASGGDSQAEIDLMSRSFAGRTEVDINASQTVLSGALTVNGGGESFFNGQIQAAQFNMNPPMAIPPNYPLSTDNNTGSSWASGERGYINSIVSCLNSLITSLRNRGLMS